MFVIFNTNVVIDEANLARIYRETLFLVNQYHLLVNEGRCLDVALRTSRYIFWSGILELMDANPCSGPLKVDGSFLRQRVSELSRAVQERHALNDLDGHLSPDELNTLHDKIDKIAGYLCRLTVSPDTRLASSQETVDAMAAVGNDRLVRLCSGTNTDTDTDTHRNGASAAA